MKVVVMCVHYFNYISMGDQQQKLFRGRDRGGGALEKKQLCRENTINGGIGCPFDDKGTRVDKTHCLLDDQR